MGGGGVGGDGHSSRWSRSLFAVSSEESSLKELMKWKQQREGGRCRTGWRWTGCGGYRSIYAKANREEGVALFSNPIEKASEGQSKRGWQKGKANGMWQQRNAIDGGQFNACWCGDITLLNGEAAQRPTWCSSTIYRPVPLLRPRGLLIIRFVAVSLSGTVSNGEVHKTSVRLQTVWTPARL